QAGINGGVDGSAYVNAESIITTISNIGGGNGLALAKGVAGVNGANVSMRLPTSTGGTVTITYVGNNINFDVTNEYALSSGSEFQLSLSGTGAIAFTVRRQTIKGRQSMAQNTLVSIAAGTVDISLQFRSLVAGQTTTIR